jgi:hypothetical protein
VAGQTDDTENLGFTIDPVAGKIVNEWAPKKVRTSFDESFVYNVIVKL